MARRSRAPFRVSVAAATPAALADAAVSAAAGPEGMYITGSRAGAPPPGRSDEASSHGGRDVEAGLVGAAVVCQGCQSSALAARPFARDTGRVPEPGFPAPGSFSVPSDQGGRDACAVPAGSSAARLSTQPSCSQGGRSNVWVLAGAGPLLTVAVASVVGAATSCTDATGASPPGTESPA